jgi:outer membrane biosynthesis protein TonB
VLLASLALHALLLWGWSREEPAPRPPPLARLQWVDVEPVAEAPQVAPAPPAAASTPVVPPPSAPRKKKKPGEVEAAASAPAAGSDAPTQASGTIGTSEAGDLPVARRPNLNPGLGVVLGMPPAADAEGPRGTTVRNGPGEEPDPVAAREYAADTAARNLNAALSEELGKAAIAVGTVPGHFRRAEDSMRAIAKKGKVEVTEKTSGEGAREVAQMLLTGGISPEAARAVTDTPLGYSIANQNVSGPTVDDQRFRESAMALMGATEELKKRVTEPRLKAILELVTDPYGTVANAVVLQKSGDRKFDESVLHLSRKAFRALPDNDEKALGASWWKTVWQFTWAPPPFPGTPADVRVKLLDAHRIPPAQ